MKNNKTQKDTDPCHRLTKLLLLTLVFSLQCVGKSQCFVLPVSQTVSLTKSTSLSQPRDLVALPATLPTESLATKWTSFGVTRRPKSEAKPQDKNYGWTKKNLAIALPALLGLTADPLLSMVDTAFVGQIGPLDLAALGVCTSIFHMCFTVFRASTVATTSLVAGAGSDKEARQISKISLQLAGVFGTGLWLAMRLLGPQLLKLMGASKGSAIFSPACQYLFNRCWAAPAVLGILVAEGVFRGSGDTKTPFLASCVASVVNLILDPFLMFTCGWGIAGAAFATALSQFGALALYVRCLIKRKMLQSKPEDQNSVKVSKVLKTIAKTNLSMLTKSGSLVIFYSCAAAHATRLGSAHVAAHQVALSFWWMVTYWLDSASVSGQVLMGQSLSPSKKDESNGNSIVEKVTSLTKYMTKFAILQGIACSAIVFGVGRFIPNTFTRDPTVQKFVFDMLPTLSLQQTLISLTLVLESLAIGGNQFIYMAVGTALCTLFGIRSLYSTTNVAMIWSKAVTTLFATRLVAAVVGVARVHLSMRKGQRQQQQQQQKEVRVSLVSGATSA